MFKRQTTGSVVCVSCGYLVGVNDETCYNCGRRNPGLWGFAPALRTLGHDLGFVPLVTGLCVIVYVASLLTTGGLASGGGLLGLLAPSPYSLLIFGASGVVPVFSYHRWWTVLSACWLHANLLHIAFNLLWIRQLAPAVAELYGAGRMVVIYVIAGVLGFVLSSLAGATLAFLPIPFLQPAAITVGASGAIMGLMGALIYYGRRTGSSAVSSTAWNWAIPVFIFGLIMPGIDNYAHIGGFAGGYLAGMMLDPLKPERINHILWAVICLVLSVLSVVVSVIDAFL
jgi:rhomboid protease GluP